MPLLVASRAEDEVIVFYTQKSPHMNYENVRMLKETDKEADFIKCFEGSNALDFQLVSELGYRLHENGECDYIIVSNDTGFDAVVRYWSQRKMPVSRLSGKECYRQLNDKKKGTGAKVQETTDANGQDAEPETADADTKAKPEAADADVKAAGAEPGADAKAEPETADADAKAEPETAGADAKAEPEATDAEPQAAETSLEDTEGESEDTTPPVDGEALVRTLSCCISKENLVDFHNALVALLGVDEGKKLYQDIKGNAEYTLYWSALPESSQKEKFELYCGLVFDHSEFAGEAPDDFAGFLYQASGKRKNLNSLRAALQGHYGKDKGMKYYSLFKSHIKIMNRM